MRMEPVKDFVMVMDLLRNGEIVCITNPYPTYFGFSDNKVQVKNDHLRTTLSVSEFESMFVHETFYLSLRKQDQTIDESKDEEYYSWKNK